MATRRVWSLFITLVLLFPLLPGLGLAQPAKQEPGGQPEVDPQILAEMAASPDGTTGVFVLFRDKADLSPAYRIADWNLRGWLVYDALRATADRSQAAVRAWLDARAVSYHALPIDNSLFLTANQDMLNALASFPEIAAFRANYAHPLEPIRSQPAQAFPTGVAWSIALVGADQVWSDFGIKGQGIVVANIDTGVEYTHDALFPNYRCGEGPHEDCWYDPSSVCPAGVPCDNAGHGTHTMGTMAGDDDPALLYNVGMAPDAQWIACKGCEDFWCSDFALNACADWILAPNGNPDNRPHVVNNSWGGGNCDTWYQPNVQAWRAAGIFPAFSAGNSGPFCDSLGSPGDYPESFASGASDSNDVIADFSSRGPSCFGQTKPEVAAPGVDVCSSVPGNGWECYWSGTSMASPHSAGLVALLWSANPGLIGDIDSTEYLITSTAVPILDGQCGEEGPPNNVYGWGRIDAYAAVSMVTTAGHLDGHVQDGGGNPLANVTIRAERDRGGRFVAYTDPSGYYTMSIPAGTYTVTASLYGYLPETVSGIEVITDQVTTQDFTLVAVPFFVVSGTVADGRAGWPLYAHITIEGDPIDPPPPFNSVWTDPLSGFYSVTLAGGIRYTFNVDAWANGYGSAVRQVGPLTGAEHQDFALEVDLVNCQAPGYQPAFVFWENFENGAGNFKASGVTSWDWGTPTSGPGSAHSGEYAWATNPSGNYLDDEDGYAISPEIDLSAYSGGFLYLSWWQWLQTEGCCDFASVEVSNDGGATWDRVYGEVSGSVDPSWTRHGLFLEPGYASASFRLRFRLRSDFSITYPGYYVDDVGMMALPMPSTVYQEDFEANNGNYTISGTTSWDWGAPSSGPGNAYSGINVWATNLAGNYSNNEDGYTVSPVFDLSAYAGRYLYLSWWQWLRTEVNFDYASVEVSNDGGANWSRIYGEVSGMVDPVWAKRGAILDPSYAGEAFRVRFRLRSDVSINYPGYYLDDVAVAVFDPVIVPCELQPGGLVVGHVYDANTGGPLLGAQVRSDSGGRASAQATPEDPASDEAFYTLFVPTGTPVLTATMKGGYFPDVVTVTTAQSDTIYQSFHLAAGLLAADPAVLTLTLDIGMSDTVPLVLSNQGGEAASFVLQELNRGFQPALAAATFPLDAFTYSAPAAVGPLSVRSPEARAALEETKVLLPQSWTAASPLPGGIVRYAHAQCPEQGDSFYVFSGVDGSFNIVNNAWRYDAASDTWTALAPIPAGQEGPTAVCYEGRIYVLGGGGSNQFYIYDIASDSWSAGAPLPRNVWGAAAGAWDGRIYLIGGDDDFWVGGTSAEVDIYSIATNTWGDTGAAMPAAAVTPGFVQAGAQVYVVGGWGDDAPGSNVNVTQQYDMATDTWEVGPSFASARADMALALTSQHLYAIGGDVNGNSFFDPAVAVDQLDWTAWPGGAWTDLGDPLGVAAVANNGGFCTTAFSGGEIWSVGGYDGTAIHGANQYRPAEVCFSPGVPWLSEEPLEAAIQPGGAIPITVTFDASVPEVDQPGQYYAALRVANDTPYSALAIPVTLTVIPPASWGKLAGVVHGLGYCDAVTQTLTGADIVIEGSGGQTWSLRSGADGSYVRWLEQGTYTVTVSAKGHLSQSILLAVSAGGTTHTDFHLRLFQPCLIAEPLSFEVWLLSGTLVYTHPVGVTLSNAGAMDLAYQIYEFSGSLGLLSQQHGLPLPSDTATAPAGYVPALSLSRSPGAHPQGGTVAILKDANPWGVTDVETFLAANGVPYEVHTSAEFGSLNFSQFGMIVFSGDQPQSFYDNYAAYVDKFEDYVQAGGFLNFFACDAGWNWGYLNALLPGGMTWNGSMFQEYNVIDDPAHPVVQGVPDPFWGNYASHGHFSNLPAAAHIIASAQGGGQPTIIEYRLGAGWLIAFGQPLEISHNWGWDAGRILENTLLWGYSYVPAGDVPWIWEEPISGTVPADSSVHLELLFTTVVTDPLPLGTYTATLLLVNDDAAMGTIQVPVVMHLVGEPLCAFSSSSPDDLGQITTFTNGTVGPGPLAYQWNFGDGSPLSAVEHPTHTYAQVGLYTVVLTSSNPYGEAFCRGIVSIEGLPVASFSASNPVMVGKPLSFVNTSQVNPPALSWFWAFGDGTFSTEQHPVHTYNTVGSYMATLIAVNARGSDTYQSLVEVVPFRVYLPLVLRK